MKALTVRQPWATAIMRLGKDVESRSRNIAGSYRGPVAIHVAQQAAVDAEMLAVTYPPLVDALARTGSLGEPWYGHVIGVVDLVDVHHAADVDPVFCGVCPEGCCGCSPWAMYDFHHLVLANPRPLAEPAPWRGALGLWNLPDDVLNIADRVLKTAPDLDT